MIENLINDIEQAMLGVLNNEQMSQLRKVLDYAFRDINVSSKNNEECSGNSELIDSFLSAKRVEGCSDKSMHYYRSTLNNAIRKIENLKSASNLNGNLNCSKELEHYAS